MELVQGYWDGYVASIMRVMRRSYPIDVCIADLLFKSWIDANGMADQQTQAWEELDEHTDDLLTNQWRTLSTEPTLYRGKWSSVFLMSETPGVSLCINLW